MSKEIRIDGYSIYIDEINQQNPSQYSDHAGCFAPKALDWSTQQITAAMKPAVSMLNSLRDAIQEIAPDEIELSMQFELGLNGETPVFKIVSAEASAQIAVKFVWKQAEN